MKTVFKKKKTRPTHFIEYIILFGIHFDKFRTLNKLYIKYALKIQM